MKYQRKALILLYTDSLWITPHSITINGIKAGFRIFVSENDNIAQFANDIKNSKR